MRILSVHISGFKGVDASIPWASAVVLCGTNDSGKTNILEAFFSQLGMDASVRGGDSGALELDFELDGLDTPGHPDQETFLSWLLAKDVEEWLPRCSGGRLDCDEEPLRTLCRLWSDLQRRHATLRGVPSRARDS